MGRAQGRSESQRKTNISSEMGVRQKKESSNLMQLVIVVQHSIGCYGVVVRKGVPCCPCCCVLEFLRGSVSRVFRWKCVRLSVRVFHAFLPNITALPWNLPSPKKTSTMPYLHSSSAATVFQTHVHPFKNPCPSPRQHCPAEATHSRNASTWATQFEVLPAEPCG